MQVQTATKAWMEITILPLRTAWVSADVSFVFPVSQVVESDSQEGTEPPYDAIATKYIDQCLLRALSLTHTDLGDYRQVGLKAITAEDACADFGFRIERRRRQA